jgi:hypothetical protein
MGFMIESGTGAGASPSISVSDVTDRSVNFPYSSVTVPAVYDRPN